MTIKLIREGFVRRSIYFIKHVYQHDIKGPELFIIVPMSCYSNPVKKGTLCTMNQPPDLLENVQCCFIYLQKSGVCGYGCVKHLV